MKQFCELVRTWLNTDKHRCFLSSGIEKLPMTKIPTLISMEPIRDDKTNIKLLSSSVDGA